MVAVDQSLNAEERTLIDQLRLSAEDVELYLDIRRQGIPKSPWFVLALEKGWIRGDVVTDGSYTWQGAIILGIADEPKR